MATDEELADIWMDAINAPRTDNRLGSLEDSILRKWGQPYKGDQFFGSSARFEDKNFDGKITREDFIDINNDGKIDQEDLYAQRLPLDAEGEGFYYPGTDYMRAWEQFYSDNPEWANTPPEALPGLSPVFDHDPVDGPKLKFGSMPYLKPPTVESSGYDIKGDAAQLIDDIDFTTDKRQNRVGWDTLTDYIPGLALDTADTAWQWMQMPPKVFNEMLQLDPMGALDATLGPYSGEDRTLSFKDYWDYDKSLDPQWNTPDYLKFLMGDYIDTSDVVENTVGTAGGIWSTKKALDLINKSRMGKMLLQNTIPWTSNFINEIGLSPKSWLKAGSNIGVRTPAQIAGKEGIMSSLIKNLTNFKNPPTIPVWLRNFGGAALAKAAIAPALAEDVFLGQDQGYFPSTIDMVVPQFLQDQATEWENDLKQNNISPAYPGVNKDPVPRNNYQGL